MNSKTWRKIIRYPSKILARYKEQKLLDEISGIVHVGANKGQEKDKYHRYNLDVVWIEPIPELIQQLKHNILPYPKQNAYQALITDTDDQTFEFNIANNNGASSSIYQMKEHKEIWPNVHYNHVINLQSTTLSTLFKDQIIEPSNYQGLVIDTQGSELLVLKGSLDILHNFKFIQTEVANFEAYENCCQLDDINKFMLTNGYKECSRTKFGKSSKNGGQYFNIIYIRQ